MKEIINENDQLRLRKERLSRGIKKMRLERAVLLDAIKQRMPKDDVDADEDEDTEDSSDSPPTVTAPPAPSARSRDPDSDLRKRVLHAPLMPPQPQERPLRTKKSHRRIPTSPPAAGRSGSRPAHAPDDAPAATAASITFAADGADDAPAPRPEPYDEDADPEAAGFGAFADHLLNDVLPTDPNGEAEVKDEFANDYAEYARKKWAELPQSEKTRWATGSEGRMKGGRSGKAYGVDVDMKDAGDY